MIVSREVRVTIGGVACPFCGIKNMLHGEKCKHYRYIVNGKEFLHFEKESKIDIVRVEDIVNALRDIDVTAESVAARIIDDHDRGLDPVTSVRWIDNLLYGKERGK